MNATKAEQRGIGFVLGEPVAGDTTGVVAEFGRHVDVRQVFGIARGKLYEITQRGLVRSVSLRRPGQKFAVRLWSMDSIRRYLTSLMETQCPEVEARATTTEFGQGQWLESQTTSVQGQGKSSAPLQEAIVPPGQPRPVNKSGNSLQDDQNDASDSAY